MIKSLGFIEMFSEIAAAVAENRETLCRLDGENGDGDHGQTMVQVFTALEERLSALEPADIQPAELFDLAAEAFLEVDSRAATLYASGFRRAASALPRQASLDWQDFGRAMAAFTAGFSEKSLSGAAKRNAADVWMTGEPAFHAALERGESLPGALDAALTAAYGRPGFAPAGRHEGRTNRPDFSGFDAGGASALLMLRAMRDNFTEEPGTA